MKAVPGNVLKNSSLECWSYHVQVHRTGLDDSESSYGQYWFKGTGTDDERSLYS